MQRVVKSLVMHFYSERDKNCAGARSNYQERLMKAEEAAGESGRENGRLLDKLSKIVEKQAARAYKCMSTFTRPIHIGILEYEKQAARADECMSTFTRPIHIGI